MVQNTCLEDFLFLCNSEVVPALKIRALLEWMAQCYFVSFPRLNSALLLPRKRTMVLPDPYPVLTNKCCLPCLH